MKNENIGKSIPHDYRLVDGCWNCKHSNRYCDYDADDVWVCGLVVGPENVPQPQVGVVGVGYHEAYSHPARVQDVGICGSHAAADWWKKRLAGL